MTYLVRQIRASPTDRLPELAGTLDAARPAHGAWRLSAIIGYPPRMLCGRSGHVTLVARRADGAGFFPLTLRFRVPG